MADSDLLVARDASSSKSRLEADEFSVTDSAPRFHSKQQFNDVTKFDSGVSLSFREDCMTSLISTGNDVRPQHFRSGDVISVDMAMESLHIDDTLATQSHTIAGALMQNVEEIFRQDDDGDTKLHLAVIQPHFNASYWLIAVAAAHGCPAVLDTQNYEFRQTAMHLAVLTDQPEVVRTLLVAGATVDIRDRGGNTPLHLACQRGKARCIEALTWPVNDDDTTPFMAYCHSVGLPAAFVLPQRRVPDLSARDYEGRSCLHQIQQLQCPDRLVIIDYLINRCSADVNIQEGKSGYTLLHLAVKQNDAELFTYLLSQSTVDVDVLTYSEHTALDMADTLARTHFKLQLLTRHAKYSPRYVTNDSGSDTEEELMEEYDDLMVAGQRFNSVS